MRVHVVERSQRLGLPVEAVFAFFADARNLEAITPPWLRFRVIATGEIEMRPGTLIEYRLRLHGLPVRWVTRIAEWEPGRRFVDEQIRGPYRLWQHVHAFEDDGEGGTVVRDRVRYRLPFGLAGEAAHVLFVRRDLTRIFDFRRAAVERLLRG
jgi:ligand-binding SRPBCC domain-containing protein